MEKMQRVFIVIDHDFHRFAKLVTEIVEDEKLEGTANEMAIEYFDNEDFEGRRYKKAIIHCL